MQFVPDIDECAVEPCVYGSCGDGINEYTCTCDAGYEGENCETGKLTFRCLYHQHSGLISWCGQLSIYCYKFISIMFLLPAVGWMQWCSFWLQQQQVLGERFYDLLDSAVYCAHGRYTNLSGKGKVADMHGVEGGEGGGYYRWTCFDLSTWGEWIQIPNTCPSFPS